MEIDCSRSTLPKEYHEAVEKVWREQPAMTLQQFVAQSTGRGQAVARIYRHDDKSRLADDNQ